MSMPIEAKRGVGALKLAIGKEFDRARAADEGEVTIPRPQQWTKAEVHQLRMLAKRKVSADSIAKSLGRHVGSVKTKARELNLTLSRRLKVKQ